MKKLVAILMLFFAFNLHADFSFKLGGNITKFEKEDGLLDTYYQFGTTFFFSYKHNVYDHFFFDVNLGINKKVEDIKYIVEDIGHTKTRKTVAHYTLEAPIILGYGFNIDEYNKISLYTGAYFSVKFMNDDKNKFSSRYPGRDFTDFEYDYGFLLGLEYEYDGFLLDFRFEKGFGKLDRMDYKNNTYNHQFLFLAGWKF